MRPVILLALLFGTSALRPAWGQSYTLQSPGGAIEATVEVGDALAFTVAYHGQTVVHRSRIGIDVERGVTPGETGAVARAARRAVNDVIKPTLPEKRATIPDVYNELRLTFEAPVSVTFRAYDDGVAYRFETAYPDSITVRDEVVELAFAAGDSIYIPLATCREDVDCFHSAFEENYTHLPLGALPPERQGFLPVLVQTSAATVLFTESDLWDYPGLWVQGVEGRPVLNGLFARFPLEERVVGDEFKQRVVTRRADYIARTAGTRTLPWRVLMIEEQEAGLIGNDLVYRLARPLVLEDPSWIQPGTSTEEWITSRLLYGVDFVSGLNTATYQYLIDFAADYGLEYMMFDAGWSNNDDLNQFNPDIDLLYLIDYARSKGVGIILWNLALTFDRQMEEALDRYAQWGVRGVKIDFMDRDDQPMVRFYERVAREAAKRQLFVNFHGAFKPTGMQRAYPNVLTREGVLGHEYNMWSDRVTPDHVLTIPFIRMAAGPMDYEGGAMNNGTQRDFRVVFERPMSQGTRTQQMAQYVVYESPLQYLAGSVSDYLREPEFSRILAGIPTTWDETVVLGGEIGDYVLLARRSGADWYVAAMTDWTPRTLDVPLSFLPAGAFEATLVADGLNADKYAGDYTLQTATVDATTILTARLASGGGWVARIRAR